MAKIDDIERRLLNWARWRTGQRMGSLGYARTAFGAERVDGDGYDAAARIPTIDADAVLTDEAVAALAEPLRSTVEVMYLSPEGRAGKARRLGVSEPTLDARIWLAHKKLQAWFGDRAAKARAERERVEALQRHAKA